MCAMRSNFGSVFMQVVEMRSKMPQGKGKISLDSRYVFSFARQYLTIFLGYNMLIFQWPQLATFRYVWKKCLWVYLDILKV